MSIDVVSPLRQRMIEDMAARKLGAGTQRLHISSCKRFAVFLQRSPETATVEDVRLAGDHPNCRRAALPHCASIPAFGISDRLTAWSVEGLKVIWP